MERGTHFTNLLDLASERVGGEVLFANDEFFAPKENLVRSEEPVFLPGRYTDRGKWMDGWETRRRRSPGFDRCVVRLGARGVVRGLDVDTRHFTGNFPAECALDAASSTEGPWAELLPRTALRGDARNLFPVFDPRAFTHVRLRIYPDGGVARLRVHGEAAPDWKALAESEGLVDLSSLANGGLVVSASDAFFGSHQSLLAPGAPEGMHDGWETRRRRGPGCEWVVVRLGNRGALREAEVDTRHFKGNAPAACALEVCDVPGAGPEAPREWRPLLPETPLRPDAPHVFREELLAAGPATHARLQIFPDGGVARLRLFGEVALPEALRRLNAAAEEEAEATLLRLCGAPRWAAMTALARPFASHLELFSQAERSFDELADGDWVEALEAHPRLGDRAALLARFASSAAWAAGEQAGALAAPPELLDELARANEEYEKRFGFVFVLCATGLSAEAIAASLRERLENPPDIELAMAADEQRRITRLRLVKLLS